MFLERKNFWVEKSSSAFFVALPCEECKFEADKQVWCMEPEQGALGAIMIKSECQQLNDEAGAQKHP